MMHRQLLAHGSIMSYNTIFERHRNDFTIFFLRFFSWNVSLQFAFTPLRQGGVIPETRKVCSTHLVMKC